MILIVIGILLFVFLLLPDHVRNVLVFPLVIDKDLENTLGLTTYLLIIVGYFLIILKYM